MIDNELPRELADLFAAERGAPVRDLVSPQALRAKLAATVGSAPLGHTAAGAAAGGVGKALATIALVVAAGGGAIAIQRATVAPASDAVPVSIPATQADDEDWDRLPALTVARAQAAPAIPAAPRRAPIVAPSPPAPPPTEPTPAAPGEPTQIALLHAAWSALSSGDNQGALALAQRDDRLHALGPLAEERSVIMIEALAKLGRKDDARSVAAVFFTTYPTSVHRGRVQRLIR